MGREVKRVALDFEWPLNKVWRGFINPHPYAKGCVACEGDGYGPEARHLHAMWYGNVPFKPEDNGSVPFTTDSLPVQAFAKRNLAHSPTYYGTGLVALHREASRVARLFNTRWSAHLNEVDVTALIKEGRLMALTHTWSRETRWTPKDPPHVPTPAEVNAWNIMTMGHDSINQGVVLRARCERDGIEVLCPVCGGDGVIWPSVEAKELHDNWQEEQPPVGPGYQIWETVSEGSPISPVFSSARELARHMATTRWGSDEGTTEAEWLKFIEGPGWAPSMIMQDGVMMTGVQAESRLSD